MKIVKILGGLGNQMFQYALFLALKNRFPDEVVKVDLSCFRGYPLHNGYEIDNIFGLDTPVASRSEACKVAYYYPNYRFWQACKYLLPRRKTMCVEPRGFAIDHSVLTSEGDRYFDGYWQHEEYFKQAADKVFQAYRFPDVNDERNMEAISRVSAANSVSLHIRRGDYVNHPNYKDICTSEYYRNAIRKIQSAVNPDLFCVFSNDMEWCKEHIAPVIPLQCIYVDWNKGDHSYVDMQIMTHCKHNIIANSSFSWWGAWLNRNPRKVVLAPPRWMNTDIYDPIPDSWIRIN